MISDSSGVSRLIGKAGAKALAFLFFSLLVALPTLAKKRHPRHPHAKPSTKPVDGRVAAMWENALNFVAQENDSESYEVLKKRILDERPFDQALIIHTLDLEARKKDRPALVSWVRALRDQNHCLASDKSDAAPAELCPFLADRWNSGLIDLLFFEETAPKFETVRRLLGRQDCAGALPVLKEINSREGVTYRGLNALLEAQICLRDDTAAEQTRARIKELRLFDDS